MGWLIIFNTALLITPTLVVAAKAEITLNAVEQPDGLPTHC